MSQTIIEFQNVLKKFGETAALNDVSFQVHSGDVLGILGPNGSGKTTLINLLLGLLKPTSGSALIKGRTVWDNPEIVSETFGALLEAPRLYPELTAYENLRVFGNLLGTSDERIAELLEIVEMTRARDQAFNTYSLGMRQRLTIALALLNDPEVLIFDEPTNGLDPEGIIEIRRLIQKLAGTGKTILLCSHLIQEVQLICKDVIILQKGNLLAKTSVSEISRMGNTYTIAAEDIDKLEAKVKGMKGLDFLSRGTGEELDNEFLTVRLKQMSPAELNSALMKDSIPLTQLAPRVNSLEDYFLERLRDNSGADKN